MDNIHMGFPTTSTSSTSTFQVMNCSSAPAPSDVLPAASPPSSTTLWIEAKCTSCPPWKSASNSSEECTILLDYQVLCSISELCAQAAQQALATFIVQASQEQQQTPNTIMSLMPSLSLFAGIPKTYIQVVYSWFATSTTQHTATTTSIDDREAAELLYILPTVFGITPEQELHKHLVKSLKNCLSSSNYSSLTHLGNLHYVLSHDYTRFADVVELCVARAAKNFPMMITAIHSRIEDASTSAITTDFLTGVLASEELTASEDVILVGVLGWCEQKRLRGFVKLNDYFDVLRHIRPNLLSSVDTFEVLTSAYLTEEQKRSILSNNNWNARGRLEMVKELMDGNTTIYSMKNGGASAEKKKKQEKWKTMTFKFSSADILNTTSSSTSSTAAVGRTNSNQIVVTAPKHVVVQQQQQQQHQNSSSAAPVRRRRASSGASATTPPFGSPSPLPQLSTTTTMKQCVFMDETNSSKHQQQSKRKPRSRSNSISHGITTTTTTTLPKTTTNVTSSNASGRRRNSCPTKRTRQEAIDGSTITSIASGNQNVDDDDDVQLIPSAKRQHVEVTTFGTTNSVSTAVTTSSSSSSSCTTTTTTPAYSSNYFCQLLPPHVLQNPFALFSQQQQMIDPSSLLQDDDDSNSLLFSSLSSAMIDSITFAPLQQQQQDSAVTIHNMEASVSNSNSANGSAVDLIMDNLFTQEDFLLF